MTTAEATEQTAFEHALAAPGRSAQIPESADAYGWLIGSWELDAYGYLVDGTVRRCKGEAHFAWTLDGLAVQDVWIAPRREDRTPDLDLSKTANLYGTTLRAWTPSIQAWRVAWINPATGSRNELIGRWSGKDVVQVGSRADGTPIRWSFTQITAASFHWIGESLESDGQTWRLEGEFRAKRML